MVAPRAEVEAGGCFLWYYNTKNRKYRLSEKQKPDPKVARANKRLAL